MERKTIKIQSSTPGWDLDVWEYIPKSQVPVPVMVMAHGIGCNKRMDLDIYAERFVEAGYACLVFDYRRWGDSGGYPRNILVISEQLEDYRTVVRYARTRNDVFDPKRIILWGFSFAGGHVTTLSSEPSLPIHATISLSPYTGRHLFPSPVYRSLITNLTNPQWLSRLFLALLDRVKQSLGLRPIYIPCFAEPAPRLNPTRIGAGFQFWRWMFAFAERWKVRGSICVEGALRGLESIMKEPSDCPNLINASVFLQVPRYQPSSSLLSSLLTQASASESRIIRSQPILFIAPRGDKICPHASTVSLANGFMSKGGTAETVEVDGDHFGMFPPNGLAYSRSIGAQLAFLEKYC